MLWWYGHPATFLPDTVKKVRPQFPSWTGRRSRKKGKPGTRAPRKKGESMVQGRVECEIHKWNGQPPSRLSFGALRLLLSFIEWKKKKKKKKKTRRIKWKRKRDASNAISRDDMRMSVVFHVVVLLVASLSWQAFPRVWQSRHDFVSFICNFGRRCADLLPNIGRRRRTV